MCEGARVATKDIRTAVVERVPDDRRLQHARQQLHQHDEHQQRVDVADVRRAAETRLAVDDQKHHQNHQVDHCDHRPDDRLWLTLHCQVDQHAVVVGEDADRSSNCHGSRVTVEKDHRVLVLILGRVDVRKG